MSDETVIYEPSRTEYVATGVFGIFIYGVILYLSVSSAMVGFKSKSTKRFFGSIILMSLLELPRYFALAIDRSYTSRTCYCFHLIAGIFFFLGFSIVCRQWSGLLQLGSYFRMVYGYHGLIVSNVSFAIVDFVAVGICASSASLSGFFSSIPYLVITFIEGFRNIVYSAFLSYYGLKLVRRFWRFSRLERQLTRRYCCLRVNDDQVFTKVVLRLTSVLVLTTICFLFRVTMLTAKMAELQSDQELTTPDFTLFGFLWFSCADFIPRALPSLAFIFLMRTKRPARDQVNKGLSIDEKSGNNVHAFQFVRLEAERDEDDVPGRHHSYSFSGYSDEGEEDGALPYEDTLSNKTKSILHFDHLVSSSENSRSSSLDSQSLTSLRDLQAQIQDPLQAASTQFRKKPVNYYSDDEDDYDKEDNDEDEDEGIGEKALDSLISLLSFPSASAKSEGDNKRSNSVSSRSGSYSHTIVMNSSQHGLLSQQQVNMPPQQLTTLPTPPQFSVLGTEDEGSDDDDEANAV